MARYTSAYFKKWIDRFDEYNNPIKLTEKEVKEWTKAIENCENIHIKDISLALDTICTPLSRIDDNSSSRRLTKCLVENSFDGEQVNVYYFVGLQEIDGETFLVKGEY